MVTIGEGEHEDRLRGQSIKRGICSESNEIAGGGGIMRHSNRSGVRAMFNRPSELDQRMKKTDLDK